MCLDGSVNDINHLNIVMSRIRAFAMFASVEGGTAVVDLSPFVKYTFEHLVFIGVQTQHVDAVVCCTSFSDHGAARILPHYRRVKNVGSK